MTLWLIRAGSHGEHEQKFLDEGRVYVCWDGLDVDLSNLSERQSLIDQLATRFPDEKPKAWMNWSSQIWPFAHGMQPGDWVVMPSKLQSGIYFGEIQSDYHYEASGPDPYFLALHQLVQRPCAPKQLPSRPAVFLRGVHDDLQDSTQRRGSQNQGDCASWLETRGPGRSNGRLINPRSDDE